MAVIDAIKDKAEFFKDKAGTLWSSALDLNKLAVDKLEEASKISLASAGYYTGIGIKQLRSASTVKDMETMRSFTADSISLSGEIAKKVLDDSKAMLALGSGVKDHITSLFPAKEAAVKKKTTTK